MTRFTFLLLTIFWCNNLMAGRISGTVTDINGNILPYATIIIKGTSLGTTANLEGYYSIDLVPGKYTISCQYIGYTKQDKSIQLTKDDQQINFQLDLQQLKLSEVVIKQGAEDPAYEIIRNAIKKRPDYLDEIKKYQVDAYIKGVMKLHNIPKTFMGQKVTMDNLDSGDQRMIFLSETIATISHEEPNKEKIEVTSTKVSGRSDGYGFSNPAVISLYENIVQIGNNLNPRGFISPISHNALNYYRYQFIGSYFEDGREVNKIKVTPKRAYEPLFSGIMNIIEGEWRIHSLQLMLTSESQMQFVDTLRLDQIYVPVGKDNWAIKSQVIYPSFKFMGFEGSGSFVTVYGEYDLHPKFKKNFFDNTFLTFTDSSNKKSLSYWDEIRPVPLLDEEEKDYVKKDSIEQLRKNPHYLDSIDRVRNKPSIPAILFFGKTYNKTNKKISIYQPPVADILSYNTVEGWVVNPYLTITKRFSGRKSLSVTRSFRYGFSNKRINGHSTSIYTFGKKYVNTLQVSTGKRVFQFNNFNPITPRENTISTLFFENNFMKIFDAWYARAQFTKGLGYGLSVNTSLQYQNRKMLANTSNNKIIDRSNRQFTPNHPAEWGIGAMPDNIAIILGLTVNWQPKSRYVAFPDRVVNTGSKFPNFQFSYTKGINNFFKSNSDFDKWRVGVNQRVNLKLLGRLSYRVGAGGFINKKSVFLPDFNHFNGNQILFASPYLNSFQLAGYYQFSGVYDFYSLAHVEHHLNGFLTNKIPLMKKLNWNMVLGANGIYLPKNDDYLEAFVGLENILKIIRIDYVRSFNKNSPSRDGIKIGLRTNLSGPRSIN